MMETTCVLVCGFPVDYCILTMIIPSVTISISFLCFTLKAIVEVSLSINILIIIKFRKGITVEYII